MGANLYPHKFGDVQHGRWQWGIGSDSRYGGRPYCIATINFHGAIAAGYDPEKLAPIMAESPAMLECLEEAARWISKADNDGAFAGCAAPLGARRLVQRIDSIRARIAGQVT